MTKTSHDIKNDIAKRDAEAQSIRELLSAGYAATSGQVVNEAEERRKAHQADIRKRIDAGEHVSAAELFMYGYAKADEARKAQEAKTTMTLTAEQLAGIKDNSSRSTKEAPSNAGVTFEYEQGDKAKIDALQKQLEAISAELAKYMNQ
ncbi:hypothetical protein RAC89_18165 [Paenibacillus sp. GD4]|jgi:hypothetical protein|uniref:hypothetical protein n=1 Tax=Paenibacillus sp. GD4 TaxID=3068890 RepID=UPI0027964DF8|nr:hypothetical protein [Paenibacillus sp. GD4]MDQ1912318.1 hypothetical protein [Paenibacillus sp. GD4]